MKINHVGYLIKNIEKSANKMKLLGFEPVGDVLFDTIRKTNMQLLQNDNYVVELIEPIAESEMYPLLSKYKNTIYHICYEIKKEEYSDVVAELRGKGFVMTREMQFAPLLGGDVEFYISKDIGMIELLVK